MTARILTAFTLTLMAFGTLVMGIVTIPLAVDLIVRALP